MRGRLILCAAAAVLILTLLFAGCGRQPAGGVAEHQVEAPDIAITEVTRAERSALGPERLYVTGLQTRNVQVIDPMTFHSIKEIEADSDAVGLALSPDGRRLYVTDDDGPRNGRLRVIDTSTWKTLRTVPVPNMVHVIAGDPVSLSGDGRWLVTSHYLRDSGKEVAYWFGVYDTEEQRFLVPPERAPRSTELKGLAGCVTGPLPPTLIGRPGGKRLYLACEHEVRALDSATLETVWRSPSPETTEPQLVVSLDGRTVYSLHARDGALAGGRVPVRDRLPRLNAWSASDGKLVETVELGERLADGYDGDYPEGPGRLATMWDDRFVPFVWGSRMWAVYTDDLLPHDGMTLAVTADSLVAGAVREARRFYVIPEWSGDDTPTVNPGYILIEDDINRPGLPARDWPSDYRITTLLVGAAP